MGALSGRGAVVTGASSGVGRAISVALAAQGVTVLLVARDPARLEAAAAACESTGSGGVSHQAELTEDAAVSALAERAPQVLPGVDVLVHAAAAIEIDPLERAALADLDLQYAINVRAPYALTQALLPEIRGRGGQVVFVNSTAGRSAGAGSGQYAATKHALVAVADSLRGEVNADGVRVLSLFLGRTATPMQAALHEAEGREYDPERLIQPEDVAQALVSMLALPRTAEVTDLAMRPMRKP